MPHTFDSDTTVDVDPNSGLGHRGWIKPADSEPDELLTSVIQRTWLVGGRYELEDEISSGGAGRVFRAMHRDLGRRFALKLLLEEQRTKADSRERFFVEARLASALCHRNIVSVTDYGVDDVHGRYLVMELLEGRTARERLREGPLPPRLAFDVIDQLAGGVRYMHSRGIVHGDIKPENVHLSRLEGEPRRQMVVKLLDFGLSFRQASAQEQKRGGTPPYLAPERLRGAMPLPTSDVYSLGAMLYELLTGEPIYEGSLAQRMALSLSGAVPMPPSQRVAKLDARVDALVMKALERDPAKRHPSAEAFHFELRTVMHMIGLKSGRVRTASKDAAIKSALAAAKRGDLIAVERILSAASTDE